MAKVVISGSSKLQERVDFWREKFLAEGDEVIDYPRVVAPENLEREMPEVYRHFYASIERADVFFLMNEEKNGVPGYVGASAIAELTYAVIENQLHGKHIRIYILNPPNPAQNCYDEIQYWLDAGWIKLYDRKLADDYLAVFVDRKYPDFLDKYLQTPTMRRLEHITQFCGCDYTQLYSPRFLYTRCFHSLVVAQMTWHFSHDKKQTIAALLHDVGTPCFAHCIDYVFGDYTEQESSERKVTEMIREDQQLMEYMAADGVSLADLESFEPYYILENHSPRLCTDRLDGVLHTCYVWLQTHTLAEIRAVFADMTVLTNEDGRSEIGFRTRKMAEKFAEMVNVYAIELQGDTDKYIMNYVAECVKVAVERGWLTLDDLYTKREAEIVEIFAEKLASWSEFSRAKHLKRSDQEPQGVFWVSCEAKKRNTIPLVKNRGGAVRIDQISPRAKKLYREFEQYKDKKYAYVPTIKKVG